METSEFTHKRHGWLAFALADVATVGLARPNFGQLRDALAGPNQWVERVGPDVAATTVAGLIIWGAALWFALGILAVLASVSPGAIGCVARTCAPKLLPRRLARLIAASTVVAILAVPGVATATSSQLSVASRVSIATPATITPSITLPSAPDWPLDDAQPPALPAPPSSAPPASNAADRVVVQPGDSLWLIAAHRLAPTANNSEINTAWRQWYSANRHEIGDDPGLIRPGQILAAPISNPPPQ